MAIIRLNDANAIVRIPGGDPVAAPTFVSGDNVSGMVLIPDSLTVVAVRILIFRRWTRNVMQNYRMDGVVPRTPYPLIRDEPHRDFQTLASAGASYGNVLFPFQFENVEYDHDSYYGRNSSYRFYLRVEIEDAEGNLTGTYREIRAVNLAIRPGPDLYNPLTVTVDLEDDSLYLQAVFQNNIFAMEHVIQGKFVGTLGGGIQLTSVVISISETIRYFDIVVEETTLSRVTFTPRQLKLPSEYRYSDDDDISIDVPFEIALPLVNQSGAISEFNFSVHHVLQMEVSGKRRILKEDIGPDAEDDSEPYPHLSLIGDKWYLEDEEFVYDADEAPIQFQRYSLD